jgi:hypothetical protein
MKKLSILIGVLFMPLLINAQEYKIAKNSGRLEIHLGKV